MKVSKNGKVAKWFFLNHKRNKKFTKVIISSFVFLRFCGSKYFYEKPFFDCSFLEFVLY